MLTFPPRENLSMLLQDRLFTYEHYLPWCVHGANSLHLDKTEMKLNEITKESQEEKIGGEVDVFCVITFLRLFVWQNPKVEVLRNTFPRSLLEIASFAPSFSWLWQVEKNGSASHAVECFTFPGQATFHGFNAKCNVICLWPCGSVLFHLCCVI